MTWKRWSIRLPEDLWVALREEHARTYPRHRASYNAWLVDLLREALEARQARPARLPRPLERRT